MTVGRLTYPKSWADGEYLKTEDPFLWMDPRGMWHMLLHRSFPSPRSSLFPRNLLPLHGSTTISFSHVCFLCHSYDYRDGWPANPNATVPTLVAGHAFSLDGVDWLTSDVPPYGNAVTYEDGTTRSFATVERPHLMFDRDSGEIAYLVNGVSDVWGDEPCSVMLARARITAVLSARSVALPPRSSTHYSPPIAL